MMKHFRFRLPALFVLTGIVAVLTSFYTRATETVHVCAQLHTLNCPVVKSGYLAKAEYHNYCIRKSSQGGFPENSIGWPGNLWAAVGALEFDQYVAFIHAGQIIHPLFGDDVKIKALLLRLSHLEEIVICDPGYSNVLAEPRVKEYLDAIRKQHPTIRITVQSCPILS